MAEDRSSVQQLIERARAGSRVAFAELYDLHHRRVYAVALRMARGDVAAAEDVTQDTFVFAWQSMDAYRGEGAFGAWLAGIAVRLSLNALRAARRRRTHLDRYATEHPAHALPAAETTSTRIDLDRAMGSLPDRARATLVLHLAGLRESEIARELDIAAGTVKAHLHHSRRLLLEALRR